MSSEAAEYALFSGPDVLRLLQLALTGSPEVELEGFSAQLHKLHHRPGTDVSAGYEVTYVSDGSQVTEYLVATTNKLPADARAVRLTGDGMSLAVWKHPDDPYLPGLAAACDATVVAQWLGAPAAPGVDIVSYRPMRRAVLRYVQANRDIFAKVVRPRRLPDLTARHRLLSEAGMAPAVIAEPAPGVALVDSAAGESLATALAAAVRGAGVLPEAESFIRFLDRLPATAMSLQRRASWSERVGFHGAAAAAALTQREAEVAGVVRDLQRLLAVAPVGPEVPTHGDFYEANIFVKNGQPHHLIDVDSVGPGFREDDLACLIAHMVVLPTLSPTHYTGLDGVISRWAEAFERHVVSVVALRARVAAVVLSLVAGGRGDQRGIRLDLAQNWMQRARAGQP